MKKREEENKDKETTRGQKKMMTNTAKVDDKTKKTKTKKMKESRMTA